MIRWPSTFVLPAVGGAAAGLALPMVLFHEVHESWFPQTTSDRWLVATVFGLVLGGVMTAWSFRDRSQDSDEAGEQPEAGGGTIRIGRTGRATATGGGEAFTGVRDEGKRARIRVRRTGDARAEGKDSKASTGIELGPKQ